MNISDLTKFFGLPAQNQEFDSYLTAHGASFRPVFKEKPVERISFKEAGVSLVFYTTDTYEEFYGQAREEGSMIFSALQVYGEMNDSGYHQYSADLPFDFSFKSTLEDITKVLGEPTVEHPSGKNRAYVWYDHQGETFGITFLPKNEGISFLELTKAAKEPPEPIDWD